MTDSIPDSVLSSRRAICSLVWHCMTTELERQKNAKAPYDLIAARLRQLADAIDTGSTSKWTGRIPDDVVEELALEIETANRGREHWIEYSAVREGLKALEAKGYKLVPREPSKPMADAAEFNLPLGDEPWLDIYQAVWDAAPSAKEGK